MKNHPTERDGSCVITVRGAVGPTVRAALDDVQVSIVGDRTVLRRADTDQAAMHGLLRRLQDLGLDVIDVHLEQPQPPARTGRAQPSGLHPTTP